MCYLHFSVVLRATAVPAGTAERVLAMGIMSVRLSRHGTDSRPGEIETPGFHHMIAESLFSYEVIWCRCWVRRLPSNEGIKEAYPP